MPAGRGARPVRRAATGAGAEGMRTPWPERARVTDHTEAEPGPAQGLTPRTPNPDPHEDSPREHRTRTGTKTHPANTEPEPARGQTTRTPLRQTPLTSGTPGR
ncbi:hypothetical protein GCM10010294_54020 [Streptomyces griseoloalbus]|nr:hypothetical protein GCM10010294_54020 [Streptomyces griseoloalbus]